MTGHDFVNKLHEEYGLLEAFRIAKSYLEVQTEKRTRYDDPVERKFCDEIEFSLRKLDQI